jgi:hypothetical protein
MTVAVKKSQRSLDELPDFDWRADAIANYTLAYRLKALMKGSVRFKAPCEMYFQESCGVIP